MLPRLATTALPVCLIAATPALGAVLTDSFAFDGSYDPYTATPPGGMSGWSQGSATIAPQVGMGWSNGANAYVSDPGLTLISDTSNSRAEISKVYTDAAFIAAPSSYEWEYIIGVAYTFNQLSNSFNLLGVRDEGGNGKMVMIAHTATGGLVFVDNFNSVLQTLYTPGVDGAALNDGEIHDYSIRKWFDGGEMQVSAYLDGALLGTAAYSTFRDDVSSNLGVGVWTGSTTTHVDWTIDYMGFQGIPEPGSAVLLGLGGLAMLRRRRS